jgi:hypothetical protein
LEATTALPLPLPVEGGGGGALRWHATSANARTILASFTVPVHTAP